MDPGVDPGAPVTEGFGWNVQRLEAYFYANNGILAPKRSTHLLWLFDTLMDLFGRVGLHTNVAKTASMAYQQYRALGVKYVEAYGLQMMGAGGNPTRTGSARESYAPTVTQT